MSEDKQKKKYTSAANSALPLVSVIPDSKDMRRGKKLLTEAAEMKAQESFAAERLSEIADEMNVYMEANDLKGTRWGMTGYEYRGYVTRKTLSREKLDRKSTRLNSSHANISYA